MAIVRLSEDTVERILYKTEEMVYRNAGELPTYPDNVPEGIGDELYSLIIPPDIEAAQRELIPDWALLAGDKEASYVSVKTTDSNSLLNTWRTPDNTVTVVYSKPHFMFPGRPTIRSAPGIEHMNFDGNMYHIRTKLEDVPKIEKPLLREFVTNILDIQASYYALEAEAKKARHDIRTLLNKYGTLQQAVKEEGEWLLEFADPHTKAIYDREPTKREKKKQQDDENIVVDIDGLKAVAVAHRLNIN